jgi:mannose-6-phosphate isomerase
MESGRVEPLLHRFVARPGDCVFVPAGTVHAVGAGILLAEIQQSSDATFRVYDWGRVGTDGKPRALHPKEALESTDFRLGPVDPVRAEREPIPEGGGTRERLVSCPYFALERLRLTAATTVGRSARFTILMGLGGESVLRHPGRADGLTRLGFGDTLLLPAALGPCALVAAGEGSVVLTCIVP